MGVQQILNVNSLHWPGRAVYDPAPPHFTTSSTWKTLPLPLPQLPLVFLLPLLIVALLLVSLCVLCVRSSAPVTHRRPLEPRSR